MRTKLGMLLLSIILFSYTSCVDSFVPEIERYDELMVVDGVITDAFGPYTIKLSKTAKVQGGAKSIPYPKCKVHIEDDLGNKINVTESAPGTYKTDSLAFRGIAGRKYKLSIATPDGELYESATEELLKTIEIQSVYAQQEHKDAPGLFYGRDGYQFYVDTKPLTTTNNFILWRMQCTYKFSLDFLIHHYYGVGGYHFIYNKDTFQTCYRTIDILDPYLLNTGEFQQTEIKRMPLNYEDNYTKALTIRYSLKVNQYTLNESAFNYWKEVKKMKDAGGELYTTQPYQIKNNLVNSTHPDKPVLGYFMVAGLSEKRIFVNHPPVVNRVEVCAPPDITGPQPVWFVNQPASWPVFFGQYAGHGFYMPQECLDCRLTGTKKKPDFWEE
jgi:hypothetical protein